jgi:serine protease Do
MKKKFTVMTISVALALITGSAMADQSTSSSNTQEKKYTVTKKNGGTVVVNTSGDSPNVQVSTDPWALVQGGGSYLGVDINDVNKDRVSALKLRDEHGVEVVGVDQDAPAGKAGIKEHDVILEFNGQRVEGQEQLRRMIRETPPGRTVTLGVSRDGAMQQIKVEIGDRSKLMKDHNFSYTVISPGTGRSRSGSGESLSFNMPDMPEMPELPRIGNSIQIISSRDANTGMVVDSIGEQLGEYFGVKNGEGLLVRSIEKGSAAQAAGFKAGDVILKVEGHKIADRMDWRSALRDRKSTKLNVTILRDKHEQTLTLTLPEPKKKDNSFQRWRFNMDDGDWDTIDNDIDIEVSQQGMDQARALLEQLQPQMYLAQSKSTLELQRLMELATREQGNALLQQQKSQLEMQKHLERILEQSKHNSI